MSLNDTTGIDEEQVTDDELLQNFTTGAKPALYRIPVNVITVNNISFLIRVIPSRARVGDG